MSIRPQPLYIVAGTMLQAKQTAVALGLTEQPWTREWCYVLDHHVLRGFDHVRVAVGFGASERRDWPAIRDQLAFLEAFDHLVRVPVPAAAGT